MLTCLMCNTDDGVTLHPSMTAYSRDRLTCWDLILLDGEKPPDPNADVPLCPGCAPEYEAHWTEMWTEYYRNLI